MLAIDLPGFGRSEPGSRRATVHANVEVLHRFLVEVAGEVLAEQLDKVAGEKSNHAPVALQPAHPPRAITGVEHLDQVALYESEIALGL